MVSLIQMSRWPGVSVPRTDLSYGFCGRDAEYGAAVQRGETDLKLGDLSVEVPCHEALPQQSHTMHLRFDSAVTVVSAPSSPESTTEVFRCPPRFVSCKRIGRDCLPWFGFLAGRNDSVGAAVSDGICW